MTDGRETARQDEQKPQSGGGQGEHPALREALEWIEGETTATPGLSEAGMGYVLASIGNRARAALAVPSLPPLDWNEGLCQNCRMPVHPITPGSPPSSTEPSTTTDAPKASPKERAMKFRKKPVVIDATHYSEADRDGYLFDGKPLPDGVYIPGHNIHPGDRKVWSAEAYIDTLEGRLRVSLGDWIITGVKGERYACKPDIFGMTYEPVSAEGAEVDGQQVSDGRGASEQDQPRVSD